MKRFLLAATAAVALMVSAPIAASDAPTPDPLAQIRAEHVMMSTPDYDGTIAWYRDKLGFRVAHEWTVPGFEGVNRHKLAVTTWALVYPTITLILLALEPFIGGLAAPIRTLILTAIMVPVMTYVAMPLAARILPGWFGKPSAPLQGDAR